MAPWALSAYAWDMRPLLLALLAALPAAAHERQGAPADREPGKEPSPFELACRAKTVRLTLTPNDAPEPPEGAPRKATLTEEAALAAHELGGRVRYGRDSEGNRTLKWTRGKKSPQECEAALLALAGRMPGRLFVMDPRYGHTRERVAVGTSLAGAEVAKTEKALPKAELANSPGFFERFFDGGTSPLAAAAGPGSAAGRGQYQYPDSSVDPSSPQAFWAAEGLRAQENPTWRSGTNFPITFNRDSATPPMPGGLPVPESWWTRAGRSVARTADQGVSAVTGFAGGVATGAWSYAQKGWEWAKENLMRAPLARFSRISSTFGSRFHPIKKRWRHHSGVDYAAAHGTAVMAAGNGKVVSAGWNGGYGKAVVIRHPSGTETLYGHLSAFGVRAGQDVSAGRVIGNVGSTGQSTGPHLHYEVRRGGRPVDPLKVASL